MSRQPLNAGTVAALGLFLVSFSALVDGAAECPALREAVLSTPDFNSPDLTILWFTERGLKRSGRYGCMSDAYTDEQPRPAYNFAVGCGCRSWELCHSKNLDYTGGFDKRHSSRLGECGCCSWWVIFLIVLGCLLLVVFVAQLPRLRNFVKRKWREWRRRGRTAGAADLDEAESAEGSQMVDAAVLAASSKRRRKQQTQRPTAFDDLHGSQEDRRHSNLTRRTGGGSGGGQHERTRSAGLAPPRDTPPPMSPASAGAVHLSPHLVSLARNDDDNFSFSMEANGDGEPLETITAARGVSPAARASGASTGLHISSNTPTPHGSPNSSLTSRRGP
jgi:hypothetical protein